MNLDMLDKLNPKLYSDEELITLRNNLEIELGKVNELWADGLKKFSGGNFDPYSLSGELTMKSYNKKYADQASDILVVIDSIDDELALREKYEEEQRYSGKSNFAYKEESLDEFVNREDIRTLKHKQDIDVDKN